MGMEMLTLIDTAALEDTGPWRSTQSTNLTPGGPTPPEYRRSEFHQVAPGRAPHGGIDYIDQAVGGETQARGDAAAGPTQGIRSARQRFQPFNGQFISRAVPITTRVQGNVGRSNKGNVPLRAASALMTNLPDEGAVTAAFSNPALASLLAKMRGEK